MARPLSGQKVTDEALSSYLAHGFTATQIASMCNVTPQAVNERIRRLEQKRASLAQPHVRAAHASLWNIREAAEENYKRAISLLDDSDSVADKRGAIAEVRQHLGLALDALEKIHAVAEIEAFMDEVMAEIEDCAPDVAERIKARLATRRALRTAFLPPQ